MHCLYCGKPLGFLKELTDGEFCCSQHRQRYKKLTKVALSRLLETHAETSADHPREHAEFQPPPRPAPFPGAGRKPRDLGGLFRSAPQARPMSARPRASEEPLRGVPAPSLPGFSPAPVRPALGNATAVWAKLEPAPPTQPGLASLEPRGSLGRSPRTDLLSGMLRQASTPTLRQAGSSPAVAVVPQPPPAPSGRDAGVTRPILEFRTALAKPSSLGVAADPTLSLAQPIPTTVPVEAQVAAAATMPAEPLVFRQKTVWKDSTMWGLSTVGFPLFAVHELKSQAPCLRHFPLSPPVQAAPAAARAMSPLESQPWRIDPRPVSVRYHPALEFALPPTGFQAAAVPVRQAAKYEAELAPAFPTPLPVLPKLTVNTVSALPATDRLALRLRETARQQAGLPGPVLVESATPVRAPDMDVRRAVRAEPESVLPMAELLPSRCEPVPSAGVFLREVEAVQPAYQQPRVPALEAMPVREALRAKGAVKAEIRILNTAAQPLKSPGESMTAQPSVLPLLATLFRHSRMERARRTSPVVFEFEGIQPRKQMNVPLAYMELPMPIRAPIVPGVSPLRIVETFEYLRPLEQPGLNPIEVLISLWRSTPAFLRFAAVSACLIVLLWSAAPNAQIAAMVESRWGRVQESIGQRAAVELTDDFQTTMTEWQGQGNWVRSWSFERAGFTRPGRLALYRPSMTMEDYRVEFLAQIERKSVGWVYRAANPENYYASKITVVKPGPLPSMALERYAVIDGRAGPRVEIPLRGVAMHNDTPYRVQVTVKGPDFTTSIEGQLVDYWRDDRFKVGGIGFFSDTGERARLYWMKVSHQDDFIGKVCAYFYPNPIQIRSGNKYQ